MRIWTGIEKCKWHISRMYHSIQIFFFRTSIQCIKKIMASMMAIAIIDTVGLAIDPMQKLPSAYGEKPHTKKNDKII